MGNPLRDRHSPRELAASGQAFDFSIKIKELERLAEIVEADLKSLDPDKLPSGWRDTEVTGQLSFSFGDAQNGLPRLEGSVAAILDAVCQRCIGPMRLPLDVDLKLVFAEDQDQAIDENFEFWELDEENFRPLDLVEEALVMALPLAATHSDSNTCRPPDEEKSGDKEMVRPFAALKAQMDRDN
jgi:uncharacterized protein